MATVQFGRQKCESASESNNLRDIEIGKRGTSGISQKKSHRPIELATHDFRLERGLDLPVLDLLPVDPPEEEVSSDVLLALVPAAQPLGRILSQELREKDKLLRLEPIVKPMTTFAFLL